MWRQVKHRAHFKSIAILLVYPLLLSSIGYALFSQNLSVNARSSKPAYTATPGMSLNYTYTTTPSGNLQVYNVTANIKNIGAGSVTSWQAKFDLPSDFTQFSCQNTVTCTNTTNNVIINSGTGNSSIPAGGTAAFTFTFRSAVQNYRLQNIFVIGVEPSFVAVSGLTVATQAGTQTGDGLFRYKRPYTFTVTNNSGQTVKMWRIVTTGSWPTANTVISMDAGVHYMDLSSQLVMIRTTPVATGSTFVFVGTFGYGLGYTFSAVQITGVR